MKALTLGKQIRRFGEAKFPNCFVAGMQCDLVVRRKDRRIKNEGKRNSEQGEMAGKSQLKLSRLARCLGGV